MPDPVQRQAAQTLVDLLIPIVKGWCTENALAITSDGVQIHGGMGFIEETGASQHLRDARITTIYEGTTGIQANDLIGRKLARDGGAAMKRLIATMADDAATIGGHGDATLERHRRGTDDRAARAGRGDRLAARRPGRARPRPARCRT